VGEDRPLEVFSVKKDVFLDADAGARGRIKSNWVELLLRDNGLQTEVYEFLNDRKLQYWGNNLLAKIELNWQYVDAAQLQDFQTFRSAEGSALQLYQTLEVLNSTATI